MRKFKITCLILLIILSVSGIFLGASALIVYTSSTPQESSSSQTSSYPSVETTVNESSTTTIVRDSSDNIIQRSEYNSETKLTTIYTYAWEFEKWSGTFYCTKISIAVMNQSGDIISETEEVH